MLPWTRSSPSITYPAKRVSLRSALVWSTWGRATRSVLSILARAVRGILSRQEYARDGDIAQRAQSSLQWLASKPVENWYWSLTELQHRIFCTLLYHIALRCRLIGRDDGCFIALNFAVSLSAQSAVVPQADSAYLDVMDTGQCSRMDGGQETCSIGSSQVCPLTC